MQTTILNIQFVSVSVFFFFCIFQGSLSFLDNIIDGETCLLNLYLYDDFLVLSPLYTIMVCLILTKFWLACTSIYGNVSCIGHLEKAIILK